MIETEKYEMRPEGFEWVYMGSFGGWCLAYRSASYVLLPQSWFLVSITRD